MGHSTIKTQLIENLKQDYWGYIRGKNEARGWQYSVGKSMLPSDNLITMLCELFSYSEFGSIN